MDNSSNTRTQPMIAAVNVPPKVKEPTGNAPPAAPALKPKAKRGRRSGQLKHKGSWTAEEDRRLETYVKAHGCKVWSAIARSMPGRIGKQCRERWFNHLSPGLKSEPWTVDEEHQLVRLHLEVGNRWADIARGIAGRSENAVKNHFHACLRRKDPQTVSVTLPPVDAAAVDGDGAPPPTAPPVPALPISPLREYVMTLAPPPIAPGAVDVALTPSDVLGGRTTRAAARAAAARRARVDVSDMDSGSDTDVTTPPQSDDDDDDEGGGGGEGDDTTGGLGGEMPQIQAAPVRAPGRRAAARAASAKGFAEDGDSEYVPSESEDAGASLTGRGTSGRGRGSAALRRPAKAAKTSPSSGAAAATESPAVAAAINWKPLPRRDSHLSTSTLVAGSTAVRWGTSPSPPLADSRPTAPQLVTEEPDAEWRMSLAAFADAGDAAASPGSSVVGSLSLAAPSVGQLMLGEDDDGELQWPSGLEIVGHGLMAPSHGESATLAPLPPLTASDLAWLGGAGGGVVTAADLLDWTGTLF